jgi:hypothetical protein
MRPRAAGLGVAVAALALLWGGAPSLAPAQTSTQKPAGAKSATSSKSTAPAKATTGTKTAAKKPAAKKPASPKAYPTVATVGDRVIDELDIQLAADALADDPARTKSPSKWRRSLLDRCVDRELLAMDAERRGLAQDPAVKARLTEREYTILLREVEEKVLVPKLAPKPEELPDVRQNGGYRLVDLLYIFIAQDPEGPDNTGLAHRIVDRAKKGAPFDSLARLFSVHPPSKAAGGRVGWVMVRELNGAARKDLMGSAAGDVFGPYAVPIGFEIFKVGAIRDLTDDSLRAVATVDRKRGMAHDHEAAVLQKYHFAVDPKQVKPVLFATGSETPDSILASLGPDGTRPERGVRPAIGILARCDGDSVDFRDVLRVTPPVIGDAGRMRIRDEDHLRELCARVLVPRLVVRDAQERGLDKDPPVERELRLSRQEVTTRAMIARARPAKPDSATLREYFARVRHRYARPKMVNLEVAVFPSADSASRTLDRIRGGASMESLLTVAEFIDQPRATSFTLYPGRHGHMAIPATGADAMAKAVSGLEPGRYSPVVPTLQGHALARVLSFEEARPGTFEESYARVLGDWADDRTDEWVQEQLTRLRAKTPVRIVPGRLEAVKLASASPSTGGGGNQ